MTKKLLLTFALLLTAVTGAFADDSGSCGEDVSYSYVESTNTLTITGTGAMADYASSSDQPWKDNRSSIKTVVIGDDVTTIGKNAFNGCSGLTSITIPANVTSIGERAFAVCSNLATVSFAAGSQLASIGERAFGGCEGLTSIEIPASVTSIGKRAFNNCSNLATISFAAGSQLTRIGDGAFNSCSDLTSITIPASVTSISADAFSWCSKLETMTVEDGNEKYDSRNGCNAIIEKSSNTLIIGCNVSTIPDGVTTIGEGAFSSCEGLTSITIPASVTTIGEGAFAGCETLATVTVYAPSCTLGINAFEFCPELENIYVLSNYVGAYQAATNWSNYADKIEGISKPNGNCGENVRWVLTGEDPNYTLTITGTGAMADYASSSDQPWKDNRSSIKTVVIGAGVTSIGEDAFSSCTSLTSATIPASVTSIGEDAFKYCTSLTTVSFAAGSQLKSIGDGAFNSCSGLTSIVIPASVETIGSYVFSGCSKLETMTVEDGNEVYDSRNGCNAIIEKSSNTLIAGCNGSTIPDGVTTIDFFAFLSCSGLTTVTIPSSVTTIKYGAFQGCSGLTSIEIPASVTSIGGIAFDGCTGLATVTVYAPSCTLGEDAFDNCGNLTNIYVLSDYVGTYKSAWSAYAGKISVMFDGTSTTTVNIPNNVTVNGVLYNRTFTASKPSTVMLPFSKDVDDISGGKFYTFGGVQKENDKWVATMKEVTGSIEANTPYLFMPTGTSLTFTGGATLNTTGGGDKETADEGSHWTFKGTYEYMKWTTETGDPDYNAERAAEIGYAYGFAGVAKTGIEVGDFVKVASGAKIRPMGCYLLWNDTPNSANARSFTRGAAATDEELPQSIIVRLVSADGETTAIGTIDNGQLTIDNYADADGWYDMSGHKLSGKPTKKGLYINNGKKIMIK